MTEAIPLPTPFEGRGPTLATIHEVERILRESEEPLSINEIKRRMPAKSVQHKAVRLALEHLERYGLIVIGSKGVLWLAPASPKLLAAIRRGTRL